ncbi:Hypothetical predicted protein [Octopus vulgaris]|uniref:Transmembrane protein 161B n=1 Tax=Octopus vulgaris TaxID=6645 RepID=A0AA36AL59_OCTVU|nr:Hypothetical predicted protein [Octopus vulgaris]
MAVLGLQMIFSLIAFTFLYKLSRYYSFGRWILSNRLVRYLHPTNEELKTAAGIPSSGGGGTKARHRRDYRRNNNQEAVKTESFTVPRSVSFTLETAKVEAKDLLPLHYFGEFQWLMDFSLCALIVYIITEIYYSVLSRSELNVSILWCLLVLGFCFRILLMQTSVYFQTEDGGERILCITFSFFFLVAAMGVLIVSEDNLEFGLEKGYKNFSENAMVFMKEQGVGSEGPISLLTFKIILAILCAFIGAFVTFPGLRLGKMHVDALNYSQGQPILQSFLYISFVFPMFILLMWVKPVARDLLCGLHWRTPAKIMSESAFETTRLIVIAVFFLLRFGLMSTYLQSHLNLAYERVEIMRKESGRISNIEIQKMIARVYYYLCFVALQYFTPILLVLFLTFLLKTLGDYSWESILGVEHVMKPTTLLSQLNNTRADPVAQVTTAIANIRGIFTSIWYRGLLSFLNWWIIAAWFTTSVFGTLYYTKSNVG